MILANNNNNNIVKTIMTVLIALCLQASTAATAAAAAAEKKFQVSPESAQWYYDMVFNPYNGVAAITKNPKATAIYASFYAEDAILCEPDGYGLCMHGRDDIASKHVLPFHSVICHAIHPMVNTDNNSLTTGWVCATDWDGKGEGCMSALKGSFYMEFTDDGLIKKKIATVHPDDPVPPKCFIPPQNNDEL